MTDSRTRGEGEASSADPRALAEFDRLGYCFVRGAFEPALVDALEEALVRHERLGDAELPPGCPRSWTPVIQECRLLNVLECGAPFARLIDHAAILAWVRRLVPGPVRLTAANSITRARGVGLPLHRIETATYRSLPDGPRCDHVTAVVWLSDCGPEDGPMVVFEGTHRDAGALACARSHPRWRLPDHDRSFGLAFRDQERGPLRAWEELPGYRELHAQRGDLLVFAECLWHGAQDVRSARVRRSLYYSYAPYHCANWHGIQYSRELLTRVTPEQRVLLQGPFIGTRYAVVGTQDVPDLPEFPLLPDSELGARRFPSPRDVAPDPAARVRDELQRAAHRFRLDRAELQGIRGACELRLGATAALELTVRIGDRELLTSPGRSAAPDAVVEAELADFARLLDGEIEASELFNSGLARVRGELRLAMRLTSFLLGPRHSSARPDEVQRAEGVGDVARGSVGRQDDAAHGRSGGPELGRADRRAD